MCKLGVISQQRLKIDVKLLLSANRKSCAASIGTLAQRMTLNDRFTHRVLSLRESSFLLILMCVYFAANKLV